MREFVEQCRREWRRLRVPDPVADEMAAELAADLDDAEAEGASAEELLGDDASDPRRFAASWAAERGVVPRPRAHVRARLAVLAGILAVTAVAVVGAALTIIASPRESAPVAAATVVLPDLIPPATAAVWVTADPAPAPGPRIVVSTDELPPRLVALPLPGPPQARGAEAEGAGVDIHTVGSILLTVGMAGMSVAILFLLWSSWAARTSVGHAASGRY